MSDAYPRDLIGYGRTPPHADWPGGARIAIQMVLNYEEGGEVSVLHGDDRAETFLSDMIFPSPVMGARSMSMESIYEYGSRAGVWRLLRLFDKYQTPVTVFGVAQAMERNPAAVEAMLKAGHEIASHGWRWINYQDVPEAIEREHMQRAIEVHTRLTGERPLGWYTGRTSPNTRRITAEGGFLYDADDYSDDLPFWTEVEGKPQLIVPYTLEANDMRFSGTGLNTGEQFFSYLKDAFDVLYAEGETAPKMLSIGLHCRLIGRPGKIAGLERFIRYAQSHQDVWFARRVEIARHWRKRHPLAAPVTEIPAAEIIAPVVPSAPLKPMATPSLREGRAMSRGAFVIRYGGIYEDSPWVAEGAYPDVRRMAQVVEAASPETKLALVRAHPQLASRARMAEASMKEQAGSGLDACTPEEFAAFQQLNAAYNARFGFPFIIAVKGMSRQAILAAFEQRLHNDPATEFAEAMRQIHRIAAFRLEALEGQA
jgi:OHCU decarboxylase